MALAQPISGNHTYFNRLSSLLRTMGVSLTRYWTDAQGYQKFVYRVAALMFISALFHTGVFLLDDVPWEGPISWRKPIVFGLSLSSTLFLMAWVLNFMPTRHRLHSWLMRILAISMSVEYGLIVMQVWRGEASHFNYTTPFNNAVFGMMGTMILIFAMICIIITGLSFLRMNAPSSMVWAIRIGLLILVVSQFLGYAIVQNGTAQAFSESGELLRDVTGTASIFGAAGNMKVPHAVTLHALQVLPILAWLLFFSKWTERRRTQVVLVAAGGYIGLVIVSMMQTFSGVATFNLSVLNGFLLLLSVMGIIGAYLAALWALQQAITTETPQSLASEA